jgi:putative resolvase
MTQKYVYNIAEASRMIGVTPQTLRVWETDGKINPVYTPGGHRRYTQEEINRVLGLEREKPGPKKKTCVIYARVHSKHQEEEGALSRQEERLVTYAYKNNWEIFGSFTEVACGLGDARPEFNRLIELVKEKRVNYALIESRDRLSPISYDIFSRCLAALGVEVKTIEDGNSPATVTDLLEEMTAVNHHFCAKIFGNRGERISQRLEKVLLQELQTRESSAAIGQSS